jgi:L-histidine N-alpha-methyltransferase
MEISQVQLSRRTDRRSPLNFRLSSVEADSRAMEEEVISGLKSTPKTVSPKYLYDAEGSMLFDRICELPEYYPTRTETSILQRHAGFILDRLGRDLCVIEVGAGACHKGKLLLETGRVSSFLPVDISVDYLRGAALRVAHIFPHVSVHAVAMDFLVSLESLESLVPKAMRRLIFYAGSSIGNFDPSEASCLLRQFSELLREDDALLIGYDLKKDPKLLRQAYDDSEGVTAAFNLNLLSRFNRELGADFDLKAFRHVALYDETLGRVEMHLESLSAQEVKIANERILFERSERIHTENSYKYSLNEFDGMAAGVGLARVGIWMDQDGYFAVGLYSRREFRQAGKTA